MRLTSKNKNFSYHFVYPSVMSHEAEWESGGVSCLSRACATQNLIYQGAPVPRPNIVDACPNLQLIYSPPKIAFALAGHHVRCHDLSLWTTSRAVGLGASTKRPFRLPSAMYLHGTQMT